MRRSDHHVNLYATACRSDQPFNNDGILIAFILQENGVRRAVDELRNALSPIAAAPDEM